MLPSLETILSCVLALKVFTSGVMLITPNQADEQHFPPLVSMENDTSPQDKDNFETFIALLKDKGMSFLTLIEAGALYLLWVIVKDTKSREELLEKIFEKWSKEEKNIRQFGKLFRSLGVPCLATHDSSLSEIASHLKQKHYVVLLIKEQFLHVKKIEGSVFILAQEIFIDSQSKDKIDIDKEFYDALIFFEKPFFMDMEGTSSKNQECE